MIRRVDVLRSAAAAGTTFALPIHPASADETVLRIGAIPIDAAAEVYYAQAGGIFKKYGLAAEIQPFTSGVAAVAAMIGGAINISISDTVAAASAHVHGLPLTLLAPSCIFNKNSQVSSLMVLATSSIRGPRDLNGKIVATNGLMNIVQIPSLAWIDNNGGDSRSVKFIELPIPVMPAALQEHRVDAVIIAEPWITNSQASGEFRVIPLTENNIAPTFLYSGWATTTDWVAKNADVVKRFVSAMNETAKWSNANQAQTAKILSNISKVPLEVTMKMGRVTFGERFEVTTVQPVIDAAAKYGAIAKAFPAAEIINAYALH
jgi:NitT/TauT family transport system substrate-binding protein